MTESIESLYEKRRLLQKDLYKINNQIEKLEKLHEEKNHLASHKKVKEAFAELEDDKCVQQLYRIYSKWDEFREFLNDKLLLLYYDRITHYGGPLNETVDFILREIDKYSLSILYDHQSQPFDEWFHETIQDAIRQDLAKGATEEYWFDIRPEISDWYNGKEDSKKKFY